MPFEVSLRVFPNDTLNSAKMLRGSKYISLGLINVVFELPGFAIGVGHANHDGSGLHQGEKPAK